MYALSGFNAMEYKDISGRIIQAGDILINTYFAVTCPPHHKIHADDDGDLRWDDGYYLQAADQTHKHWKIINR